MTVTTQQTQIRHDDWMDALCYAIIERMIRMNRGDGDDDDGNDTAGASAITADPQD